MAYGQSNGLVVLKGQTRAPNPLRNPLSREQLEIATIAIDS